MKTRGGQQRKHTTISKTNQQETSMRPPYMSDWYVATSCKHPVPHPWEPMKLYEAEGKLRDKYGNIELLISAYSYPTEVSDEHTEGFGNLYFDFDGSSPTQAHRDAKTLVDYLQNSLGIADQDIHTYFSGNKGYHVFVNATTFGIKPFVGIHKFFGYVATKLASQLKLDTLDLSIYNRVRMFRVANSIHIKSGRYRIFVPLKTFLARPHVEIANRAAKPGENPPDFRFVETPEHHHKVWFDTAFETWHATKATKKAPVITDLTDHALKMEGLPVCVQDLIDRFMTSKYRFEAQSRIIAFFKASGVDEDECFDYLKEAVEANYPPSEQADRLTKVKSAIQSVYTGAYTFSCAYSLSVTRYESDRDKKVKCIGGACPLDSICGTQRKHPEHQAPELMEIEI